VQEGERPTTLIVIVITLVLAALIGLAVPFGSGNRPGGAHVAWTPPTPTLTAAPLPPATATETPAPTQTGAAARTSSRTVALQQLTATSALDLTPSPSPTDSSQPEATEAPRPPATRQAPAAATTTPPPASPVASSRAEIAVELANLRSGPGQGFRVVGLAKTRETFTVTARSGDGFWLQICCVNQAPAWLATGLVTITGTIEGLPIAP
jgi:hypothetical protein